MPLSSSTQTKMSESPFAASGSSIDYVEGLKTIVPQRLQRKVLSRFVVMKASDEVVEESPKTLLQYKYDNDSGLIQPPLSEDLVREMDYALDEKGRGYNLPSAFLLAWVMAEDVNG